MHISHFLYLGILFPFVNCVDIRLKLITKSKPMEKGPFLGSSAQPVWYAVQENVQVSTIEELHGHANEYYNYVRGEQHCLTGKSNSLLVAAVYNPTTKTIVAATIPKDTNTQKEMMTKALQAQVPVWGSVTSTWDSPDFHAEDHAYFMAEMLGALGPSSKSPQKYGDGTKGSVMIAVWGQMAVPKGSEATIAGLPGTPISLCSDVRDGRNNCRAVASLLGVYHDPVTRTLTAKEKKEQESMAEALMAIVDASSDSDSDICVAVAESVTGKRSASSLFLRGKLNARRTKRAPKGSLWKQPNCKAEKTVTITALPSKTQAPVKDKTV